MWCSGEAKKRSREPDSEVDWLGVSALAGRRGARQAKHRPCCQHEQRRRADYTDRHSNEMNRKIGLYLIRAISSHQLPPGPRQFTSILGP